VDLECPGIIICFSENIDPICYPLAVCPSFEGTDEEILFKSREMDTLIPGGLLSLVITSRLSLIKNF
jgi:hypothetical protein